MTALRICIAPVGLSPLAVPVPPNPLFSREWILVGIISRVPAVSRRHAISCHAEYKARDRLRQAASRADHRDGPRGDLPGEVHAFHGTTSTGQGASTSSCLDTELESQSQGNVQTLTL